MTAAPPFDRCLLRFERPPQDWPARTARALSLIDEAIRRFSTAGREVRYVFAAFSGGHDSLAAASIAARHPLFKGVLHLNTGIGIEETRIFVRDTCRRLGWPLVEVRAREDCGQDYEQLVVAHGFPGPAHHYKMWQRLKERGIRFFFKHHVPQPHRAILVSGRRSDESEARMLKVDLFDRDRRRVFVSAIHDWSGIDVTEYIEWHSGLTRNPVVDLLHRSGECQCGAYARPGELAELGAFFPRTAAHIRSIETKVRAAGHEWGWEEAPPRRTSNRHKNRHQMALPFCSGCQARSAETYGSLADG